MLYRSRICWKILQSQMLVTIDHVFYLICCSWRWCSASIDEIQALKSLLGRKVTKWISIYSKQVMFISILSSIYSITFILAPLPYWFFLWKGWFSMNHGKIFIRWIWISPSSHLCPFKQRITSILRLNLPYSGIITPKVMCFKIVLRPFHSRSRMVSYKVQESCCLKAYPEQTNYHFLNWKSKIIPQLACHSCRFLHRCRVCYRKSMTSSLFDGQDCNFWKT